jgi:hypothetical protein
MSSTADDSVSMTAKEAAILLQDRLHQLLSRLAEAVDLIKTWPEAKVDDASVHVQSTSRLISHIRSVISSIQRVESAVQTNPTLKKKLQECLIPLDLLDLLDHGSGGALNPDCFVRGLLREALGQLAGLKRRKLALELLGSAVQSGLARKQQRAAAGKRLRAAPKADEGDSEAPPGKKQRLESPVKMETS